MVSFTIASQQPRQVIDLTDAVRNALPDDGEGVAVVWVRHTTAALTTADLDPGTDLDLLDFLAAITPQRSWRHPHDPAHAPDHLLASLIGSSLSVPFAAGELVVGSWQRLVLVELAGPRERQVSVSLLAVREFAVDEDDDE